MTPPRTNSSSLFGLIFAFCACLSLDAPAAPIKVLLVTGGHGFEQEPFYQVFRSNPELEVTPAAHAATGGATVFERNELLAFDAVVLYDMPKTITEAQQKRFLSLFDRGVGLVVLHHALVSYQHWDEYERIVGGRYPEEDGKSGVVTAEVGYQHDVDLPVSVVAPDHPITAGVSDFVIHDEIYWGFRVRPDVTPLLTTTLPKSGKPLAWTRTQGESRVVYLQLGHGPSAYTNSSYRKLVAQSIRWASHRDAPPATEGWEPLFDGKTLDGWVQHGGAARYSAEDGQIVGRCAPNTPNSFLCTRRDYTNFDLRLEFKVDSGLNSGVQIRSHVFDHATNFTWRERTIRVPAGRVHGLQVEIDPSARAWTGGLYEEGARGWLNDLKANEPARQAFRAGEWNQFRIECHGTSLRTWLNDVPAADLNDDRVSSGFIALQVHGVGRNQKELQVRFRSLRVRPLP
jgi:type 1 glutamine amidotransferase